jgi:hypothetical protein
MNALHIDVQWHTSQHEMHRYTSTMHKHIYSLEGAYHIDMWEIHR